MTSENKYNNKSYRYIFASYLIMLGALLVLSSVSSVYAVEWTKQYTENYLMGEGDSRIVAREILMEKIRIRVSNDVGTYVQKTENLKGDQYSEAVQMISASIIKINPVSEKLLIEGKSSSLQMVAQVAVDETVLKNRIKEIQADQSRIKEIVRLKRENEKLIEKLVNQSTMSSVGDTIKSLSMKSESLVQLKGNTKVVRDIFGKGTLLALAKKSVNEFDEIKDEIDKEVFQYLLKEVEPSADILSVVKERGKYIASVKVSWSLSHGHINSVLEKWLDGGSVRSGGLSIYRRHRNSDGNLKHGLTPKIFNYLGTNPVSFKVSLGSKSYNLPVLFVEQQDNFSQCDEYSKSSFAPYNDVVCIASNDGSDGNFRGVRFDSGINNPLKFELTQEEAQMITEVRVEMVAR